MDHFDRSVLRELTDKADGLFISIYMPTSRVGQETRQNTIRLRNMLRSAEDAAVKSGVRRSDAVSMLAPTRELLDNSEFWQHQDNGLAIFAGHGFFRTFRVPIVFRELLVVADRLHVKPLLELFVNDGEFLVLALSQRNVRLLHCRQHLAERLDIPNVPRSFDEFMESVDEERQMQFHTGTQQRSGERSAIFHAGGSESDEAVHKKNLQDYVRLIVQAVDRVLVGRRQTMVLAGTDFIRAMFREMSGYRDIAGEGLPGSPDRLSDAELRDRAWPIVQPDFAAAAEKAIKVYHNAVGTPLAGDDLPQIVEAAYQGLIDTLFVSLGDERWGRYDPRANVVASHDRRQSGDVDLLDLAAVHTLLHHGRVFAFPARLAGEADNSVPAGGPAAALFRTPGMLVRAASAE